MAMQLVFCYALDAIINQIKMALIKCPECGKDMSEIASICPSCGNPNPEIIDPVLAKKMFKSQKKIMRGFLSWFK
jgi:hypothetical protein